MSELNREQLEKLVTNAALYAGEKTDILATDAAQRTRLADHVRFQAALIDKMGWEMNLDSSGGDACYRRKNWRNSEMEVIYASTIEEIIKEELG